MDKPNTNWAGNIAYAAARVHEPRTIAELQSIVRHAGKVRALGSRHSFNRIADTDGDLVAVRNLNRIVSFNEDSHTITAEGGITYGELCAALHKSGFAIHNLASLPHIGVVGATATATHGSGNRNGNLATAVAGLKIVTATGDIVELKRGDPDFEGAVVNLGALGIVAEVTLHGLAQRPRRLSIELGLTVPFTFAQAVAGHVVVDDRQDFELVGER